MSSRVFAVMVIALLVATLVLDMTGLHTIAAMYFGYVVGLVFGRELGLWRAT